MAAVSTLKKSGMTISASAGTVEVQRRDATIHLLRKLFQPDPTTHSTNGTLTAAFAVSIIHRNTLRCLSVIHVLGALYSAIWNIQRVSYHIEVRRSLKEKHGGYLNSPPGYRRTSRPRSRRLWHTMALIGGENCLRSQERCCLHGLSDILARQAAREHMSRSRCHLEQKRRYKSISGTRTPA